MNRGSKPTGKPPPPTSRAPASIEVVASGDAALVSVSGLVDENFGGFGDVGAAKTVVLNVSGMTRMTSFGVRQWLKAMSALPKSIADLYLLGCPTFFVDQLNMVLNFGGAGKVLTVIAPHTCTSCGVESGEVIDVLAERANLAKGSLPEKTCARCGGKLEFDETPESYFAFMGKYAATSIHPAAAQMLTSLGLYLSSDTAAEKPPRIIKLVHGSVTYFRIIGTIGAMFRARPFLVGAEGEVVIDLAEVGRLTPAGQKEWRRLVKSLAGQVPALTVVDVNESFLANAGDTITLARNIHISSVLVPYRCLECGRISQDSATLERATWPMQLEEHICTTCGGTTRTELPQEALLPLRKASTTPPPPSAKVIAQRGEIMSRALTDANVAQARDSTPAVISADDTILGKYKIVQRLSAGGMAEVFLANQVGIGGFEKPVALKRIQHKLLETRHLAIELFLNEAKIAGRLTHPNIVQVLDVGEEQGALFLAMEYVHGKDLRRVIKRLQQARIVMPLGEACYIVRGVAQALDHAYWSTDMTGRQLSVVHRDVSPHNVILGFDGTVKLLDFGVAMSAVTEHAETMIVGKWLYMSPEATMNGQIDHRSDLFSLGVILYLLCTGQAPFTGTDPREIVKKIRAGTYKPLPHVVAVPDRLASLVGRLLAPNPDDRPQRGQEVAFELEEIARHHGLDSSATSIAYILKQLFGEDGTGGVERPRSNTSSIREIVKSAGDEIGSLATERSGASVTPNSVSISSRRLAPVDMSQTFKQRTGPITAQQPQADAPRHVPSDTLPLSPRPRIASTQPPTVAAATLAPPPPAATAPRAPSRPSTPPPPAATPRAPSRPSTLPPPPMRPATPLPVPARPATPPPAASEPRRPSAPLLQGPPRAPSAPPVMIPPTPIPAAPIAPMLPAPPPAPEPARPGGYQYQYPPAPETGPKLREGAVLASLIVVPIAAALAVAAYILGYL